MVKFFLFHHPLNIIKQRAFTLFEMLVVLVIVGLASGVVMMNTTRTIASPTPEIIKFLEQERAATLLTGQITQIQLQDNRLYSTANKNSFPLPQQKQRVQKHYLPSLTLTTFYPDGTMSASKFTLETEKQNYEIETNPFSNKIHYTQQVQH